MLRGLFLPVQGNDRVDAEECGSPRADLGEVSLIGDFAYHLVILVAVDGVRISADHDVVGGHDRPQRRVSKPLGEFVSFTKNGAIVCGCHKTSLNDPIISRRDGNAKLFWLDQDGVKSFPGVDHGLDLVGRVLGEGLDLGHLTCR